MKRRIAILVVGSVVLVTGCATPVVTLRHAETGQVVRCGGGQGGAALGGVIGYHIEKSNDEKCVQDFERQGFKRAE